MARARARPRPQGGQSRSARGPLSPSRRTFHLVLTTATATAAAAAGSAGAAVTGDSLVTRNYKTPRILSAWATRQSAGFSQLSYPTGHDTSRGWRVGVPTGGPQLTLPVGMQLPLTPQEQIASLIGENAVAGDVGQDSWLTAYEDDQGQNWLSWESVRSRMRELTTIESSLVSAAGPNYSGTELITADSDLLLANREYALLGFTSRTAVHCIGIVGPDTGNDRIGQPGMLRFETAARFFPMVIGACPVLNSGNKASTNLFCHTDENAGTFVVTAHLALLS